jgi:hypothetical protein
MLPVAIGLGEGGEFYRPMAIAIIGGTITSTVLTLLMVPTFYDSIEIKKDSAIAKVTVAPSASAWWRRWCRSCWKPSVPAVRPLRLPHADAGCAQADRPWRPARRRRPNRWKMNAKLLKSI